MFYSVFQSRILIQKRTGKFAVRRDRGGGQSAFSLLELLTVMGIVAILLTFSVVSVGTLRGRNLVRATDQLRLLFEGARQHALASGNPTAAVILTNFGSEASGRGMILMEYSRYAGWRPLTKWNFLPEGSCIEVGVNPAANTFVSMGDPSDGLPDTSESPVIFQGKTVPVGGYAYRVFLPKGEVLTTTTAPIQLRVLEGQVEGGVTQSHRQPAFTISLIAATGQTKIDPP